MMALLHFGKVLVIFLNGGDNPCKHWLLALFFLLQLAYLLNPASY
jgi:hypothetical protein